MQTELYSLSKIFTENLYRIPDYQRGYSWKDKQLKDFWSDLVLLDPGRDHYTGVLTLEETPEINFQKWSEDLWILQSKRYRPFYVVDGQQRLTTSLLLLQALLEQLQPGDELNYSTTDEIRKKYIFESKDKGLSRSYIFGYEKDNPSYEFLKTRIFMEQSDNHENGEQTIYTHNLMSAKQFFKEKLSGMPLDQLEEVYTKLTQHFLLNIYTINSNIDVFVAFETMNNRGKPLSHLELLKNRLIFLSTRLNEDPTERSKVRSVVNEAWKTAYHFLGRNKMRPLDDDDFLSNQFIVYVGPSIFNDKDVETSRSRLNSLLREDNYKSYLLDNLFTYINITKEEPGQLTEQNSSQPSNQINQNERLPLAAQDIYNYAHDIKNVVQVYYRIFNPGDSEFPEEQKLVLTQLSRLGWREALPLGLAVALKSKGEAVTEFLRAIERHLFIRTLIPPIYYRYGDPDLIEMAIKFKKGTSSLKDVTTMLNSLTEKSLATFGTSEVIQTSYHRGYYGWRAIRYLMFEYEQELKRKARAKRDKITWEEFSKEHYEDDYSTIEHIYPQRPKAEEWKTLFARFGQKERAALRNSLGNLVALSRPKNSALGNRKFVDKKTGSNDTLGYVAGSYSEIEVSQFNEWNAQSILQRGLKMLNFMEKRWHFKIKDQKARYKILGLSFLDTDI